MGSVGPMELLVVLVIALLVFGPKKLPEIGRGVGSAIREFRRHSRDLMSFLEEEPEPRRVYPEPTPSLRPAATDPVNSGDDPPAHTAETYPVNAGEDPTAAAERDTPQNSAGEEPVPAATEATDEEPVPAQLPSAPPSNTHPTA